MFRGYWRVKRVHRRQARPIAGTPLPSRPIERSDHPLNRAISTPPESGGAVLASPADANLQGQISRTLQQWPDVALEGTLVPELDVQQLDVTSPIQ